MLLNILGSAILIIFLGVLILALTDTLYILSSMLLDWLFEKDEHDSTET